MLKRTPFKRKPPARKVFVRAPRAPVVPVMHARAATMRSHNRKIKPIEKEEPVRSEAYRRLICTLACARCGIFGHTQPCHADENKGAGMKTSDLTCWPGCGPHDGLPGCHYIVGSTGTLTKQRRRELEQEYAAKAQRELLVQAKTDPSVARVLRSVGLLE